MRRDSAPPALDQRLTTANRTPARSIVGADAACRGCRGYAGGKLAAMAQPGSGSDSDAEEFPLTVSGSLRIVMRPVFAVNCPLSTSAMSGRTGDGTCAIAARCRSPTPNSGSSPRRRWRCGLSGMFSAQANAGGCCPPHPGRHACRVSCRVRQRHGLSSPNAACAPDLQIHRFLGRDCCFLPCG